MKLSRRKVTRPAAKQVFRRPGLRDTIALRDEPLPPGAEPLLETVMTGGRRTAPAAPLDAARRRFEADLAELPDAARRIRDPQAPEAGVSEALARLTEEVRRRIETRVLGTPGR